MFIRSQKEVEILEEVGRNGSISQRALAKSVGLSLGLVNIIIRKLIQEGYIRINHLNKKRVEYLLTPLGHLESEKINSQQTNDTIKKFKRIEIQLTEMLKELHGLGYRYFSINGMGELRQLLESIFNNCLGNTTACLEETSRDQPDAVLLNFGTRFTEDTFSGKIINVLERIGSQ